MPDIFNKDIVSRSGPLARSETAALYVKDKRVGLAQQVSIQYGQPVNPVYELGSFDEYAVSGRTRGQAQIARVIGVIQGGTGATTETTLRDILPDTTGDSFWQVDGSKGGELVMKDLATNLKYTLSGCRVLDYGVSVAADGSMVNENVSIMFHSLEIDSGQAGSGSP